MNPTHLIIVIASLLFSAFFSGIEIAFVSADKLEIELGNKQGNISDRILSRFLKKPSWFISTTLIGNNIALVVYGIFMAYLLVPVINLALPAEIRADWVELLIQTILATLVVLITAEFTPKSLFLINPNKMLSFFAVPVYVIYIILFPAVWLIVNLSKFLIVNILKLEYSERQPVFGLTDLNHFIKKNLSFTSNAHEQEIDPKIFTNAIEFKRIKIRECMVPRTDLVTVDIEDGIDELSKAFIESGYSKIPVYKESIDNIIGYCNSLEMFKKPKDIESILTPIMIVPETMHASELMIQFITERKSIALVVDEFGGTSGIVTIEDIIEEIFGEIQDEHDEDDLVEVKIDDNNYLLSARQEIDYLNDKYNWELPEGDYDTLGGLILSITKDIPEINQQIDSPPFHFVIISIDDNKIDKVKLRIEKDSVAE